MLTDPKLKSKVDQLWDKFWTGGLTNPLDAIEQFSYLLFLKRLDDTENKKQRIAEKLSQPYLASLKADLRWSQWTKLEAKQALKVLKEQIFPNLRTMGGNGSSFQRYMENAECKINKPSLLIEVCNLIDQMEISQQQQDMQGDLYEYLLSKLNQAGRNGQFRTPRHIIRLMVQMIDPKPRERIGDLAAGTCGFLVNAYQYILEKHTSKEILSYDEEGWPHNLIGDQLTQAEWLALKRPDSLRGFDNDSGMTMLRIGSMNLMLHGIEAPQFFYMDTLSKTYQQEREFDVILMNPPFKGAVDENDLHESLQSAKTKKSELLFLHQILRVLDMGGRCAVIVPDGVLFGSSRAHVELRRKLVENNRLDGVVSMPGGVFKPYAGVSTAILFFTRGAKTKKIWFYDMAADGFSLDDKRVKVTENDLPDILTSWQQRFDESFQNDRQERIKTLKQTLEPLHQERLTLEAEINQFTFEAALAEEDDNRAGENLNQSKTTLENLMNEINPLKNELDQLTRQFWVDIAEVKANKYDLSASRYRVVEQDEVFFEKPEKILARIAKLEHCIANEIPEVGNLLK